jgi:hypothetical protein
MCSAFPRKPRRKYERPWKIQIHHVTYERLGEEDLEDVICLCPWCHGELHDAHNAVACGLYSDVATALTEIAVRNDSRPPGGFDGRPRVVQVRPAVKPDT